MTLTHDLEKIIPDVIQKYGVSSRFDFVYGGEWKSIDAAESKVDDVNNIKIGANNIDATISTPFSF